MLSGRRGVWSNMPSPPTRSVDSTQLTSPARPCPTRRGFAVATRVGGQRILVRRTRGRNPYVQRHFSTSLQTHIMQLWGERERFYSALDRAPQIFSHFDCQRRNLIIRSRTDDCQELVAVDWGLCGINALGGDLMALIGSSVALYEWEPAHLATLEATVFDAYLLGLWAGGWRGNADWVRLAYAAWLGLHWGLAMPAAAAFWCVDAMAPRAVRQFGRPLGELVAGWVTLCEFSLARADEARQLMARLKP